MLVGRLSNVVRGSSTVSISCFASVFLDTKTVRDKHQKCEPSPHKRKLSCYGAMGITILPQAKLCKANEAPKYPRNRGNTWKPRSFPYCGPPLRIPPRSSSHVPRTVGTLRSIHLNAQLLYVAIYLICALGSYSPTFTCCNNQTPRMC